MTHLHKSRGLNYPPHFRNLGRLGGFQVLSEVCKQNAMQSIAMPQWISYSPPVNRQEEDVGKGRRSVKTLRLADLA